MPSAVDSSNSRFSSSMGIHASEASCTIAALSGDLSATALSAISWGPKLATGGIASMSIEESSSGIERTLERFHGQWVLAKIVRLYVLIRDGRRAVRRFAIV